VRETLFLWMVGPVRRSAGAAGGLALAGPAGTAHAGGDVRLVQADPPETPPTSPDTPTGPPTPAPGAEPSVDADRPPSLPADGPAASDVPLSRDPEAGPGGLDVPLGPEEALLPAADVESWFLRDLPTLALLAGVFFLLALAAAIGFLLRRQGETTISPAIVDAFNNRVVAWWTMFATLIVSVLMGRWAVVILFFCISFWALREFITMTPTRLADHRALDCVIPRERCGAPAARRGWGTSQPQVCEGSTGGRGSVGGRS